MSLYSSNGESSDSEEEDIFELPAIADPFVWTRGNIEEFKHEIETSNTGMLKVSLLETLTDFFYCSFIYRKSTLNWNVSLLKSRAR